MAYQNVRYRDLGLIEYGRAWNLQEELLRANLGIKSEWNARRTAGEDLPSDPPTVHHLLFCEHPPVYTLGKSGKMEHVLIDEHTRAEKGVAFFHTNRGGDITFHGPGQLVGYPVIDLEKFFTDIGRYLRMLEDVIIHTMAEYGLKGERSPGETGVWLEPDRKGMERKICAMGVRCSRWVTMHGFAFNVNTDLSHFDAIIPCGIRDKKVTSLSAELGRTVPMDEVSEKVRLNFEKVFGCITVTGAASE
jgi:lipoyl(octanoyl) transferase